MTYDVTMQVESAWMCLLHWIHNGELKNGARQRCESENYSHTRTRSHTHEENRFGVFDAWKWERKRTRHSQWPGRWAQQSAREPFPTGTIWPRNTDAFEPNGAGFGCIRLVHCNSVRDGFDESVVGWLSFRAKYLLLRISYVRCSNTAHTHTRSSGIDPARDSPLLHALRGIDAQPLKGFGHGACAACSAPRSLPCSLNARPLPRRPAKCADEHELRKCTGRLKTVRVYSFFSYDAQKLMTLKCVRCEYGTHGALLAQPALDRMSDVTYIGFVVPLALAECNQVVGVCNCDQMATCSGESYI